MKNILNKKTLKLIAIIALICIIVGTIAVMAIDAYVKNSVKDSIIDAKHIKEKYDCILVLGCGVYSDGTPSPMLEDRLRKAIDLYKSGVARKIIMSGDHGQKEYDEVNTMRKYALSKGVPGDDIFMDHAGFSTYESMYRARDIFKVKSMIAVSQEYHLYRAVYIAKKFGINTIGVGADYRRYLGQTMRDIRETAARCKDFFKCIFKPYPTFRGEPIPVSGSGKLSWD